MLTELASWGDGDWNLGQGDRLPLTGRGGASSDYSLPCDLLVGWDWTRNRPATQGQGRRTDADERYNQCTLPLTTEASSGKMT
jgi:hypothetical protein